VPPKQAKRNRSPSHVPSGTAITLRHKSTLRHSGSAARQPDTENLVCRACFHPPEIASSRPSKSALRFSIRTAILSSSAQNVGQPSTNFMQPWAIFSRTYRPEEPKAPRTGQNYSSPSAGEFATTKRQPKSLLNDACTAILANCVVLPGSGFERIPNDCTRLQCIGKKVTRVGVLYGKGKCAICLDSTRGHVFTRRKKT